MKVLFFLPILLMINCNANDEQMRYKKFAEKIIDLRNNDLELRSILAENGLLSEGYNERMEEMHNKNATTLNEIIEEIGYPTINKVGKEANEAAWLIIQHSIGRPDFMKKCEILLTIAIREQQANPINLAYLSDRIATFEGNAQLYGTQFDWDENGELNPLTIDNLDKVNQRRKSVGLNTLEEQTVIIRNQAKSENESAPVDREKKKLELEEWKKVVGWIN